MNNWLKIAHDWLLPRQCLLCRGTASDIDLCPACRATLPRIENPCQGCGTPLRSGQRCAPCVQRPPPFDCVRVPYLYAYPVKALIHALKFGRRLAAASVLGSLLTDHLKDSGICPPQWIVPVPLHPERQRERGFNQSLEIARALSACLKVRIAPTLARRTLPTVAQSSLQGADSRRLNVSGAFSVDTRWAQPAAPVAIVDDVVTTGATVAALALALKRAGVTRIEVWSIARAREP